MSSRELCELGAKTAWPHVRWGRMASVLPTCRTPLLPWLGGLKTLEALARGSSNQGLPLAVHLTPTQFQGSSEMRACWPQCAG